MSVSPTPAVPAPLPSSNGDGVKIANPDLFIENMPVTVPIDSMTDLIFQEIGGHEIIGISRNDLVNGRNISYQLVRNLEDINIEYNSQNILPVPGGSTDYFNSFPIRFNDHIPTVVYDETDTDGNPYYYLENPAYSPSVDGKTVYLDENGDLIIDLINMKDIHSVEIEIVNKATIQDDTIYIGDIES